MKCCFTSTAAFAALMLAGAVSMASAQPKICIDPGHGGSDPGAVGGGQTEAANVLDTGLKFRDWLNLDTTDTAGGSSWSVIMTRTTDTSVSLSARSTFANNNSASRFMSIHNNAFSDTSANGIETFSHTTNGATSNDLRNKVYEEATAIWPLTKRGVKQANFAVLRDTNMAAELHEMGFITNTGDRAYLGSATERNNHAKSELWAIQRHYGVAKYTPTSAPTSVIVDNTSAGFNAPSTAWFTGTSVAGYYGSNYHARATEAISDAATWTVNLPSSGSWRVDAWWTAATNRSATAPYLIYHSGGTASVSVNQQANGGKWNALGTYSFGSGNREVKLSCWTTTGYFVIADAVRFVKQ